MFLPLEKKSVLCILQFQGQALSHCHGEGRSIDEMVHQEVLNPIGSKIFYLVRRERLQTISLFELL